MVDSAEKSASSIRDFDSVKLVAEAARYNDIAKVDEIRAAISNIAYAWKAVA